jgi:integrase/recombinase XerD
MNVSMEAALEQFIRYLATERGLSDNYQLSVRRSLEGFAQWLRAEHAVTEPAAITLPLISSYLAARKRAGLAAGSI